MPQQNWKAQLNKILEKTEKGDNQHREGGKKEITGFRDDAYYVLDVKIFWKSDKIIDYNDRREQK